MYTVYIVKVNRYFILASPVVTVELQPLFAY